MWCYSLNVLLFLFMRMSGVRLSTLAALSSICCTEKSSDSHRMLLPRSEWYRSDYFWLGGRSSTSLFLLSSSRSEDYWLGDSTIMTRLSCDSSGGLSDFPFTSVAVSLAAEMSGVTSYSSWLVSSLIELRSEIWLPMLGGSEELFCLFTVSSTLSEEEIFGVPLLASSLLEDV